MVLVLTVSDFRYEMGLLKLESSAKDVNTMKANLDQLQPKLIQSTNEVNELLKVR